MSTAATSGRGRHPTGIRAALLSAVLVPIILAAPAYAEPDAAVLPAPTQNTPTPPPTPTTTPVPPTTTPVRPPLPADCPNGIPEHAPHCVVPGPDEPFDADGYDDFGYDRSGFDRYGYDRWGYDRQGYDRQGYDRLGLDRDGYTHQGCRADGVDREWADRAICDAWRAERPNGLRLPTGSAG